MRTQAFLLGIVLFAVPEARADQLIGLLTLPEVFGREACEKFEPQEVVLYATPIAQTRVGSIRVDRYWEFHAVGGCAGLEVKVHRSSDGSVSDLPVMEHAYEAPAAIVLERRGQWFKVELGDGFGWLHASARDEFHSLEALLTDGLLYLTTDFDGRLRQTPGGTSPEAASGRREILKAQELPVRALAFRQIDGELWVEVEILSHSLCTSSEPTVTRRGWLPAHDAAGRLNIWFHSRGC